MIDTAELIKSVFQEARIGTSGYEDQDEVNRNIKMVEMDLFSTLIPLVAKDFTIQTLLANFLEKGTVAVGGLWTYPNVVDEPDVFHSYLSSTINGKPVYPKTKNEIDIILNSSVRKPTEDGPYYSTVEKTGIQHYPKTITELEAFYYRYPVYGTVTFNTVSDDDSDYVNIVTDKAIQWPEKAFNILHYSLLERYGVDCRESLALEYSQLGIKKELSKL